MPRRVSAPALLAEDAPPLSFEDLSQRASETRQFLRQQGLAADACVAVVIAHRPLMAATFIALAQSCCCAPLNPSFTEAEFAFAMKDTGAAALIVDDNAGDHPLAAARECGVPVFTVDRGGVLRGNGSALPSNDRLPGGSDIALYLHTSGTTARPKLVPIRQSSLAVSAQSVVGSLELGDHDCCLSVMPLFHIHGLVAGLLAPLIAGGRVWCAAGFNAHRFFGWLSASRATWYTAVPTMHQTILLRARYHADMFGTLPLRFIRSSSAPLVPHVSSELRRTFGVPVVNAYGMTEAAHQISSTSLGTDFDEMGTVGRSTGPELAILTASGAIQSSGDGEILIRGASVLEGYAKPPDANATAFCEGWLRTGDEGSLDDRGILRLTGRIKELINTGGEKVSPYEVEEVLLRHHAVQEAAVFAAPHPLLGEAVAAAVVPREHANITPRELREYASRSLAPAKVPREVVIVQELPRGGTGKIQRIGMAARLGLA
jgi:oxalate---CoA ligase